MCLMCLMCLRFLMSLMSPHVSCLKKIKKMDTTPRCSRVVPHLSTERAQRMLTSEFGWDLVHYAWYGRIRRHLFKKCLYSQSARESTLSDNSTHPIRKMIKQVYLNTVQSSQANSYLPGIVVGLGPLNPWSLRRGGYPGVLALHAAIWRGTTAPSGVGRMHHFWQRGCCVRAHPHTNLINDNCEFQHFVSCFHWLFDNTRRPILN